MPPFDAAGACRLPLLSAAGEDVADVAAATGADVTFTGFVDVDAALAGLLGSGCGGGVDVTTGGAIGAAGGKDESAAGGPLVVPAVIASDGEADVEAGADDVLSVFAAFALVAALELGAGALAPVELAARAASDSLEAGAAVVLEPLALTLFGFTAFARAPFGFAGFAFAALGLEAVALAVARFGLGTVAPFGALVCDPLAGAGMRSGEATGAGEPDETASDACTGVFAFAACAASVLGAESGARDSRTSAGLPPPVSALPLVLPRAFGFARASSRAGAARGAARPAADRGGTDGAAVDAEAAASFDAVVVIALGVDEVVERSEV